jgi:hypothetical protein
LVYYAYGGYIKWALELEDSYNNVFDVAFNPTGSKIVAFVKVDDLKFYIYDNEGKELSSYEDTNNKSKDHTYGGGIVMDSSDPMNIYITMKKESTGWMVLKVQDDSYDL